MRQYRQRRCAASLAPVIAELDALIRRHQVSLADLERRGGPAARTMSNWFHGKTTPTVENIEAVANVMGYRIHLIPIQREE